MQARRMSVNLFPVLGVLREGGAGLPVRLKTTAREAAEKTIPMRAIRGRAVT